MYCSKTCLMWSKTFASRYINFRAVCSSIHHQCWMKKVIMRCAEVRGYREDFQCRIFVGLHLLTWYCSWETKMQSISGLKEHYTHSKLMLQSFSQWLLSWEYIYIYFSLSMHSFQKSGLWITGGVLGHNTMPMVFAYLLPVLTRVTQPWYLLISTHCTTCRWRAERGPAGECR